MKQFNIWSKLSAWFLVTLTLLITVPTTGCTVTTAQLKSDATTLANALNSLAAVAQATSPAEATALQDAANALNAAAQSSLTGPTWENALNAAAAAAESIMATIPITAPYASLLAIAVAAAEMIISNTTGGSTQLKALAPAHAQNLVWYLHTGHTLVKHRFGRSPAGDLKAAWNNEATHTGYGLAAIK